MKLSCPSKKQVFRFLYATSSTSYDNKEAGRIPNVSSQRSPGQCEHRSVVALLALLLALLDIRSFYGAFFLSEFERFSI